VGTHTAAIQAPPTSEEAIDAGELIPILLYGAELHKHPTESMRKLLREWQRWIVAHGGALGQTRWMHR